MNKFGQFIYKNKIPVIAVWAAIVIVFGFFALKVPSVLGGSGFDYDGTYNEVEKILDEEFGIPESSIILLFEKTAGSNEEAFEKYIKKNN